MRKKLAIARLIFALINYFVLPHRLMSSSGFISYSCRPIEPIKPVAFTSDDSHVVST